MSIKQAFSTAEDMGNIVSVNGAEITAMDSSGALALHHHMMQVKPGLTSEDYQHFQSNYLKLILLVMSACQKIGPLPVYDRPNIFARLGMIVIKKLLEFNLFLNFLGVIAVDSIKLFKKLKKFPLRSLLYTMEYSGVYAIPLIALLSFLIGMVLAYQMGLQLKNYGANIYIADLLGLSILREFAPLMTAIIVAGRSGASFTAQLGTMKIGQEIDALTTMGLSPSELLILPKIWGLCLALPLLTILASVFGILGGMCISKTLLDVNYMDFLQRFNTAVPVKSFWIGLVKAPVFGFAISAIGCFQGLQVSGSATSVGEKTTTSVVQAIFMIIILDAAFSVLFSQLGY